MGPGMPPPFPPPPPLGDGLAGGFAQCYYR